MQKLHGIASTDRWKHLDELFERETIVEVIEQSLRGNAGALEYESAAHEFGIRMHRAVIESEHGNQVKRSGRQVNHSEYERRVVWHMDERQHEGKLMTKKT